MRGSLMKGSVLALVLAACLLPAGRAEAQGDGPHNLPLLPKGMNLFVAMPMGLSGVHAVPKTLHSHGLRAPRSTCPHWHARGSATRCPGSEKRASASHGAPSAKRLFSASGVT